jgi:beta-fructofuranosidase
MRDDDLPAHLRDDERIADLERRRGAFRDDPYRPGYHFVPPGGTLHDPNGACYWNGRYHLFYQFWPPHLTEDRSWDEAMHWGHAVSDDLLYWQDLPIALAPDPGPETSCYSGQALVEDDRVVLAYHGPGAGNCVATADDEFLVDVEKHPDNPVIPLDEDAPYDVFDPCLWREGDTYYSLSGGETEGRTAEFLFRSADLAEWEYLGPLVDDGHHTDLGEDGAVPNFFAVGDTHVLLFFSHNRGPQYYVGEYEGGGGAFEIDDHGRMNFGPVAHSNLHAPSVVTDDDRRVAVFNVKGGVEDRRERPWEGWTEVMSLPRVLDIGDGGLTVDPVPEVETLRADHHRVEDRAIPANDEVVVSETAGASIELAATVAVDDAQEVGMTVLRSPDGAEETTISYWDAVDALGIDTSRSTERVDVLGRPPEVGPLALADDERLRLRVFVDRSIVEVFANGRQCLTARAYPDRSDSVGVSLFARRGSAHLASMDLWTMQDVWT